MTLQQKIREVMQKPTTVAAKFFELVNDCQLTQNDAANVLGIPYRTMLTIGNSRRIATPRQIIARESLNLNFTFGVEIESLSPFSREQLAEQISSVVTCQSEGYNHTDHHDGVYKIVRDGSLRGEGRCDTSAEVVTPVLREFDTLQKVVKKMNEVGCKVNSSCGLHVHIGAADLTFAQYKNVFINYARMERVIDTFMALSRRGDGNCYCYSLVENNRLQKILAATSHQDLYSRLNSRYFKVNPASYSVHKTIEFRQHQGSLNFTKIKNWVNFCKKLVAWSRNHTLENEINSINEIPFLTATEKAFFERRKNEFANNN